MNKKGIFSTILVIQLIFLVLLSIYIIQDEKTMFEHEKEYRRLAAYRINGLYEDIEEGWIELDSNHLNANDETKQTYVEFINNEFADYNLIDIEFNSSYLKISDSNLEIVKEGWLS
jgi:hypothetical protein